RLQQFCLQASQRLARPAELPEDFHLRCAWPHLINIVRLSASGPDNSDGTSWVPEFLAEQPSQRRNHKRTLIDAGRQRPRPPKSWRPKLQPRSERTATFFGSGKERMRFLILRMCRGRMSECPLWEADIRDAKRHVRFTPESRHVQCK